MNKQKTRRPRAATPKQATKPAAPQPAKQSAYDGIIDAISLVEVVRRSIDPEAHELVALKCALRSMWQVHDRLDELGIGADGD